MGITRRELLRGVAVGSAGLVLVGCGEPGGAADDPVDGSVDAGPEPRPVVPPEGTPMSEQFPLGVSAGDLGAGGGVVWAQYAGTSPLATVVWRMDGDTYVEELGPFPATPGEGGFTHVAISGLTAGARYRYAFFELDGEVRTGRSLVGTFRAPIADDATEVITFGAIACTESGRAADPIQRAAEHEGLDAFLFVGDNAYCEASDLAKYRTDYADHFGRPAHVALRASAGMYITWDDHEVVNDWNPETIAASRIEAAFTAFFDHAPIARAPGAANRIWRSSRWGKTVEVFVLDTRSERLPSTRNSQAAQYISPEQLAWLKAGLASSPAAFKVIMNSVPITNMPALWDLYAVDRWEGYAAQRTEILSYIDDNSIGGVVWLAGDFHLAFIAAIGTAGQPGANQREILCGPGGQNTNPLLGTLNPPQFSFTTGTNNYTTLRFDAAIGELRVTYHDGTGAAFHTESFVP